LSGAFSAGSPDAWPEPAPDIFLSEEIAPPPLPPLHAAGVAIERIVSTVRNKKMR